MGVGSPRILIQSKPRSTASRQVSTRPRWFDRPIQLVFERSVLGHVPWIPPGSRDSVIPSPDSARGPPARRGPRMNPDGPSFPPVRTYTGIHGLDIPV